MTWLVFYKLLAVFFTVALGWAVGRTGWLGPAAAGTDPARQLGNAAMYLFVPALLFRSTARLDTSAMPWTTLLAFFVPAVLLTVGIYALARAARTRAARAPGSGRATLPAQDAQAAEVAAGAPAAAAVASVFGNSVQVGIPVVAAVFGEQGLGLLVAIISLHALVLLSVLTVLAEVDRARARRASDVSGGVWRTLRQTVVNTVVHPVVLPVLAGLLWRATGWALPGPVDETLQLLGTAVAPLCLVLIGMTLAYSPVSAAAWRTALLQAAAKLLLLPAVVLAVAHGVFGLRGLPLGVVVLMAALPTGTNALIFAQRYRVREAEATSTIVLSTVAFMLTAPAWLALLDWLGR